MDVKREVERRERGHREDANHLPSSPLLSLSLSPSLSLFLLPVRGVHYV